MAHDGNGSCHEAVYHRDGGIAVGEHLFKVAAQALPTALQGHDAACTCLQVHVVGCRCSTLGTIVEHHELGILGEHLVHLADVFLDALRCVTVVGNREVGGQDGERVHQQREIVVDVYLDLLLWTILGAEEATTLLKSGLVYFGSRRYHTGWVEL